MTQRINYISRYKPNEFGTSDGSNIPTGTPSDQWMKNQKLASNLDSSIASLDKQASIAQSNIVDTDKSSKGIGVDIASNTMNAVPEMMENSDRFLGAGSSAATPESSAGAGDGKGEKAGLSKAGAFGAAAGIAVAGIAGNALDKRGHEVAGGALKGASSGASMGMMVAGPIGGAIGAGVGAIGGAIMGKKKQKDRIEAEKEVEDHNAKMAKLKKKSLTQADDLRAYQGILSGSKGTQIMYKTGGLLKYDTLDVKESLDYVNSLIAESYKSGGKLKDKSIINFTTSTKELKTTPIELKSKEVTLLRRGGTLDVHKENVIVDGPSHDEENNTGVKGDRGLPVVKDGKKIAEIESLELVLNSNSSSKLDSLIKEFKKTKDSKIKEQIGELLSYELGHNTYDYSNLLK